MVRVRASVNVFFATMLLLTGCGGGENNNSNPTSGGTTIFSGTVNCSGGGNVGTLTVSVFAPNGTTPIPAASVRLLDSRLQVYCEANAGTGGALELRNVSVGSYTVSVKAGIFEQTASNVVVTSGGTSTRTVSLPSNAKQLAVVPGDFDSIEDLLTNLGFAWTSIAAGDLQTTTLNQYDFVFLNCGLDESYISAAASNLANFVAAGKRLYFSDWAHSYLELAFPGQIVFYGDGSPNNGARVGANGMATGSISDPFLATAIGSTNMIINFDLPGWAVMDSVSSTARRLIEGDVSLVTGGSIGSRPLVASFAHGTGKVVYTSFHNEAQATQDMTRVLHALITQ